MGSGPSLIHRGLVAGQHRRQHQNHKTATKRHKMNKRKTFRVPTFALLALFACFAMLSSVDVGVRAKNERAIPSNIRITPPAPAFDDKDRIAELKQRRESVAQSIGPQSFMILFSTEPRVYTNDVDYPYRQENNLYYLTNLKQKNACLLYTSPSPRDS